MAEAVKSRGYKIPAEDLLGLAKALKNEYSYVAEDPVEELASWDRRIKKKNKLKCGTFKYTSILAEDRVTLLNSFILDL